MEKSKGSYWNNISLDDVEKRREPNPALTPMKPIQKSSKRSKLERYLDILKVVSEHGPIKRTHILYRANLAWNELNTFLQTLEEVESLSKSITKNGVRYEITDIGKKILEDYTNIQSSLNKIDPSSPLNFNGFSSTNL